MLARGEMTLLDMKAVLDKIAAGSRLRKRDAIPRVLLWRREQGRIAALQGIIKQVKSSLNVILGASNSYVIMLSSRFRFALIIFWPGMI